MADASVQGFYFLSQLHRTSRLCSVTLVHSCRAAARRAVHSPGPPDPSPGPGRASCYSAGPGVQTIMFLTHLGHLPHETGGPLAASALCPWPALLLPSALLIQGSDEFCREMTHSHMTYSKQ